MIKKVSVENYKNDSLYPKIILATARILKISDEISPVAILLQMGNLEPKAHDAWQCGKVPYLEKVFQGSLSKANRILRIVGFHVYDLKMVPSQHKYKQKGNNTILRFSKTGDKNIETSYARHYKWNKTQDEKQLLIENTMLALENDKYPRQIS